MYIDIDINTGLHYNFRGRLSIVNDDRFVARAALA